MINRKIALSGMSILTALTMLASSVFAAFTTQASATGNTFSTGSESLLISLTNVDANFTDTIANPFNGANIKPGYSQTFDFFLKNAGTDTLTISSSFAGGTSDTTLEGVLMTDFNCNTGNPGAFSITDMRSGSVSLGSLAPGAVATCSVTVSLPGTADNTVANKTTSFNALFNATQ